MRPSKDAQVNIPFPLTLKDLIASYWDCYRDYQVGLSDFEKLLSLFYLSRF
jgi:hypothetical protein